MYKYISLLRGINVGGHRKILMADLKQMLQNLGAKNPVTYIQSGNVVFEHESSDSTKVSQLIHRNIKSRYGFDVPVVSFTSKYLLNCIENNPFTKTHELEQLHLTFLSSIPTAENLEYLKNFKSDADDFLIADQVVYIACKRKYSDSKLGNPFIEKKLKVSATTRNWKTVLKLAELSQ